MSNNLYPLPYLSVIIPTYRDWERLQLCLNSLMKQSYPSECFEIIIVNNAPNDTPPEELIFPKNSYLVEESSPGSYAARNKGITVAKGELYVFTDSDCQPQFDWLDKIREEFDADKTLYRLGGEVELIRSDSNVFGYFYDSNFTLNQKRYVEKLGAAATANMIARKELFYNVGFFNSKLMSGGDIHWGSKAENKGFKIKFSKDCVVYHPSRTKVEIINKYKRVTGGKFEIARGENGIKLLFFIMSLFIPPVYSIYRMMKNKKIPIKIKFQLIVFTLTLKFLGFAEVVAIIFGKNSRR